MSRVNVPATALALALGLALHGTAVAQDHQGHAAATPAPVTQDHAHHPAPPASKPAKKATGKTAPTGDDHSAMGHGAPAASSEPITPIPAVTDADRAAAFPALHRPMQHAPEINSYVVFNRLEAWDAKPGSGQAWEGQAWVGSDLNRLWLRTEGERIGGKTEAADLEVFYGRSVSTWWDVLAGIKHDFNPGDSQTWAAFGVQGLAPMKFDVSATAYIGESGQTAANVEAEYELLLTNRLILQPLVEITAFGKDDPQRGIGSGLSSVEAGVRVRYEIDRRFAPYVGVVHERMFGNTADLRRADGEDTRDTRLVAGVRIWF
ncbi:copper resistance protein B [Novilysobacter avium]|uniref:Copper resistance protein B n=1 Tax=Novilysobacter avium TaxID=2781023 RepID=A0A7S6UJ10_9GAMM|nr:copper resistance protein B [Lysobacter avium]QOW21172.1 copper resistance protein B [Lysobacter avium]